MYEGYAITFLTNEHGEPATLFFGKRRPDELMAGVARAVMAIHAHPWKDIARLAAERAAGGEVRRGSRGPLAPIDRVPNLVQEYIWD